MRFVFKGLNVFICLFYGKLYPINQFYKQSCHGVHSFPHASIVLALSHPLYFQPHSCISILKKLKTS